MVRAALYDGVEGPHVDFLLIEDERDLSGQQNDLVRGRSPMHARVAARVGLSVRRIHCLEKTSPECALLLIRELRHPGLWRDLKEAEHGAIAWRIQ